MEEEYHSPSLPESDSEEEQQQQQPSSSGSASAGNEISSGNGTVNQQQQQQQESSTKNEEDQHQEEEEEEGGEEVQPIANEVGKEIYLRGKFNVESFEFSGAWGMGEIAFEAGGTTSEFFYKKTRELTSAEASGGEGNASSPIPDHVTAGYFMIAGVAGNKRAAPKKIMEKDIVVKLKPSSEPGIFAVEGAGSNPFGRFALRGTYNSETGDMNVERLYYAKGSDEGKKKRSRPASTSAIGGGGLGEDLDASGDLSRPSRVRRAPSHFVEDATPAAQETHRLMKPIVERLLRTDSHAVFHHPVDPVALGLAGYFDVVKNPMDLGTVLNKLNMYTYQSVESVADDIRLTFNNAMLFNAAGTVVHNIAKTFLENFESDYEAMKAKRAAAKQKKQYNLAAAGGHWDSGRLSGVGGGTPLGSYSGASSSGYHAGGNGGSASAYYGHGDSDGEDGPGGRKIKKTKSAGSVGLARQGSYGSMHSGYGANLHDVKTPRQVLGHKASRGGNADDDEVKLLRQQLDLMNKRMEQLQQQQQQMSLSALMGGDLHDTLMAGPGGVPASYLKPEPAAATTKKSAPEAGLSTHDSNNAKGKQRPFSYQEKRQLSQDIRCLPPDSLIRVIEIIKENNGKLGGNEEEVEIDIDLLETPALRELQKFVRSVLRNANPGATSAARY